MDTVVIELLALAQSTFSETGHTLTVRCHHHVLLSSQGQKIPTLGLRLAGRPTRLRTLLGHSL